MTEIQQGLYNPEISNVAQETGGNLAAGLAILEKIQGFDIPQYDTQVIDDTDANNVIITYKKNGATVATKTISVSGHLTTITVS